MFSENNYGAEGWDLMFKCPKCDCENVHFKEPKHISGKDDYTAWEGRGKCIEIPMYCESEHAWTLLIGFHKGYSYLLIKK